VVLGITLVLQVGVVVLVLLAHLEQQQVVVVMDLLTL
jgi:hypothetical protein